MPFYDRLILKINRIRWEKLKKRNAKRYPDLLGDKSRISVLSCNCTGGVIMSELNMEFATPTINYYMNASDFVTFCENLDYYLSIRLTKLPEGENTFEGYPICKLDNLLLHAVHYKSFEEFDAAWERRKQRFNRERIFIIFSDRDGFSLDMLDRIEKIPYRKVLFSNRTYSGYDFVFKIDGYEDAECVGNINAFKGISGRRIYSPYPFADVFREMISDETI